MSNDTKYSPTPLVYKSRGLLARNITDQAPVGFFLDYLNCYEREENSVSSRFGVSIINRDPAGTPSGQNYFFSSPVTSLAKLTFNTSAIRYAGLANGQLWFRASNLQGPYTEASVPNSAGLLSGAPFQTVVTNCFETSQPYLFIYDSDVSIKDQGTGQPSLTGLDASPLTLTTAPYAPLLTLIDNFSASNTYVASGFSGLAWSSASIVTLKATSGQSVVDFSAFFGITNIGVSGDPFGGVVDGMLATPLITGVSDRPTPIPVVSAVSQTLSLGIYTQLLITTASPHGITSGAIGYYGSSSDLVDGYYNVVSVPSTTSLVVSFSSGYYVSGTGGSITNNGGSQPSTCVIANHYSAPYPTQFSAWGFYQQVSTIQRTFPVGCWTGSVAQNTTSAGPASVTKTVALDLSYNNQVTDDDLIVITLLVSNPAAISNIRLQFDVNGSGYNASYYYKDISPAYYQSGVSNIQTAYTTVSQQVFADTLGLLTGATPNSTVAQLQPGSISTGQGAWTTCYLRRGDFVAVGTANTPGLDWSNISGWQLLITTNTVGSSRIAVNGLYLQWGYGPSSFGGVGYDYRATPYNAATGTEGNGTPIQAYDKQFGYLASLAAPIFLRQAVRVSGSYYGDSQVTHVRIYRRGGTFSDTWRQLDQIPNNLALAEIGRGFGYKDVIPDAVISQAFPLVLDNDPPVTSSLRTPIQTALSAATTAPAGTASVYSNFVPQTIATQLSTAVFVTNQVVDIGTPANLEQVRVYAGGTGSFQAVVRLQHNAGEAVNVYAVPRQPCNLCALAYGQVWLAGDQNNQHYLYFSKVGQPESFGPQDYIPVGSPKFPIVIVVNWRGTLFVATTETWWLIVGGAQPYAQPTGSIHGAVASTGWCQTESAIVYQAADGWREFKGADGAYMTLPVEFLFRQQTDTPVPLLDPTEISTVVMAFFNNTTFGSYVSLSGGGQRYRLCFDHNYQRFRYDGLAATAMLWEKDTNQLLLGVPAPAIFSNKYAIVADFQTSQDSDDGGWQASGQGLGAVAIPVAIQTPYEDLGAPHFPKQFNVLETDVNTHGVTMATTLLFNTETPISLGLAAAAATVRSKLQLIINSGEGFQAYSVSIRHTITGLTAPIFYQENIYAAVLADYRSSFDTYWIKFGSDESKIVKQAYFDYNTTTAITVTLYADGAAVPYFTFTLPVQVNRASVRVIFPAWKPRLWRAVGVCAAGGVYQFWSAVAIDHRPIKEGSTWNHYEVQM
jgi:hypothetical protein